MEKVLINPSLCEFPVDFCDVLTNSKIYDSSCSETAKVFFIDKGKGYYLKRAATGSLKNEAIMTEYMNQKGLATKVVGYITDEYDWLLTEKVQGEDCTHREYLSNPNRLCDTLAFILRELHQTDYSGCPVNDRMKQYVERAIENYSTGNYDKSAVSKLGFSCADEAYSIIEENKSLIKCDTLIHGDYCLPNIILDNWKFSGFIDVDFCGVGDKHIDIYWAVWSLAYNLGMDEYRNRFFDAYGRNDFEPEMLRTIAAFEVFG